MNYNIVIGASSAIGLAIVNEFLRRSENVIYTYNSNDKNITELQKFAEKQNASLIAVKVDVLVPNDIQELSNIIKKNNIRIKTLIYNTGKIRDALFDSMEEDSLTEIMNINFIGCFRVLKKLIQNIAVNKGSIILISSVSGICGKVGQVNYSCSKSALISFGRNLAKEYAKLGVRVNSIAPGFVKTKMLESIPPEQLKILLKGIPLKRMAYPEEIADLTYFLSSEKSSYITGQTIVIDGGILL